MIVDVRRPALPQLPREEDALGEMGDPEEKATASMRTMTEREPECAQIWAGPAEQLREMCGQECAGRLFENIEGPIRLAAIRFACRLAAARGANAEGVDSPAELAQGLGLATDERVRRGRILAREIGQPDR